MPSTHTHTPDLLTRGLLIRLLAAAALLPGLAMADTLRVAVASNFSTTITALAAQFEARSPHKVVLIFGSTGKHYAQIRNGAPFDAFFAADTRRPTLLEQAGLAIAGSRFTYAVGKVVLWSPTPGYVDADGRVLAQGDFRHLAIANPRLAPYGQAAREVLQARGLWHRLKSRLVRGENIGQTFQFVNSGNAALGFVAYAQIKHPGQAISGSFWAVPQALYAPIEQQAVLLQDRAPAREFLTYVQSPAAKAIIRAYGYDVP